MTPSLQQHCTIGWLLLNASARCLGDAHRIGVRLGRSASQVHSVLVYGGALKNRPPPSLLMLPLLPVRPVLPQAVFLCIASSSPGGGGGGGGGVWLVVGGVVVGGWWWVVGGGGWWWVVVVGAAAVAVAVAVV